MLSSLSPFDHLEHCGYALLRGVFHARDMEALGHRLAERMERDEHGVVLRTRGMTYGSRNLLGLIPEIQEIPSHPVLREFIHAVLGPAAGIVRVLYFDKPPGCSWALPWHRDRTIAVKDNRKPSSLFHKPTTKAAIPHVEAPVMLLDRMLTLRLHLDPMTKDNGPLSVIPGSHFIDREAASLPAELHAYEGDVLAMRPLLLHSSCMSAPESVQHRRVLHWELASDEELPDGYEWQWFHRLFDETTN